MLLNTNVHTPNMESTIKDSTLKFISTAGEDYEGSMCSLTDVMYVIGFHFLLMNFIILTIIR